MAAGSEGADEIYRALWNPFWNLIFAFISFIYICNCTSFQRGNDPLEGRWFRINLSIEVPKGAIIGHYTLFLARVYCARLSYILAQSLSHRAGFTGTRAVYGST